MFIIVKGRKLVVELLFQGIDKHFQASNSPSYDNLVGLGTGGANIMLGQ